MKKTLLTAITCLALFSCNNDKADEKKVMEAILATHEKVMAIEDKAMSNKMQLDSLVKINQTLPQGLSKAPNNFKQLIDSLNKANDAMESWMHNFDPDYKGKSHADAMKYLQDQRIKINNVQGKLNSAVSQSSVVLAQFKR